MSSSDSNFLPTLFQQYIYKSRYARWLWEENRRENWHETVTRYFNFFEEHLKENFNHDITPYRKEVEDAVLSLKVMPSMRALMTAGEALKRENVAGFNCSYVAVNTPRAFDEIHYILLNGTGVGFSVEQKEVDQLPYVAEEFHDTDTVIVVADSKLGWAKALKELIHLLYSGQIPKFDVSKVRPAGAPLKTFGGRASGPEPLMDLFRFCISTFRKAAGRKLTTVECHDIVCKIAETVVVGGVRRCLYADTSVQTTKGFQPIKDIKVNDQIVTGGESYRVVEHVYSGKQKLLTIKHRFGVLECTENHEVAVFDSIGNYIFKPAKDIQVGDRLVWDTAGTVGEEQDLPGKLTEDVHFNEKSYRIPTKLNDDLAWLFGYIHGDGCISAKTIEISSNIDDVNLLHKAEKIFQREFGVSGVISPDFKGGKGCRLRVNSCRLSEWFLNYIKTSHTDIQIPDFIIQSTRSNRAAYLAGLFDADGRVSKDYRIDQCTTIYPKFSKSLISLLSTLGIAAKIYYKNQDARRSAGSKCQDHYTVRIAGNTNRMNWRDSVGLYSCAKKFQRLQESLFQSVTDFTWSDQMTKVAGVGHRNRRSTTTTIGTHKDIYQPTEVVEIIYNSEEVDTYDIEVESIHQFTTDGIVVHNSALISLSDLNDDRMRVAKSGQWWIDNVQRALANNSAVYNSKPDMGIFMAEWKALYDSKSGERGIFNRASAKAHIDNNGRRNSDFNFGANPCGEILLRDKEFCNLSEAIIRATDTEKDIEEKVRIAAILGTWQSTLTNYRYLSKRWKDNCDEERLLGVSLTGIMDSELTNGKKKGLADRLENLKAIAIATNKELAEKIGINASVAVTCIKPSGTVSQLTDSSSGIHARHSPYYIRTVRADKKDPLAVMMKDMGFPVEDDITKPDSTFVFSFPVAAPKNAVFRESLSAIEQLELWLTYKRHWTEHNPSVTISVRENEWMAVGAWVYDHFDDMTGVSFLPFSEHVYKQAPYQECSKEEYEAMVARMPKNIDWNKLAEYEKNDMTTGSQEMACVAGGCEL